MTNKFGQKNPSTECNTFVGSKVMQRSTRGQFAYECLMTTKFSQKNTCIIHLWGQRLCKVQLGVNLPRNVLRLPNLVKRTPDQRVIHL